jgi:hypothetical protein
MMTWARTCTRNCNHKLTRCCQKHEEDMGSWRRHTPLKRDHGSRWEQGVRTLRNAGKNAKKHIQELLGCPTSHVQKVYANIVQGKQNRRAHRRYEQGGSRSFWKRPYCVLHCQERPLRIESAGLPGSLWLPAGGHTRS